MKVTSKGRREKSLLHLPTSMRYYIDCFDRNSIHLDPKGGDLFLGSLKPLETGVEERRRADVQIAALTWKKGRKTKRIV